MKKTAFLSVILLFACSAFQTRHENTVMNKPKIIYVYDPMCGWCFGFGKVMEEFHTQYKDSFHFDVISGGMVVGEREGPIGDFADYILNAYTRVEEASGMKFGQPYLDQLKTKTFWSSSVKPSIALETFKTFRPADVVAFSHAIQKACFVEGQDLRNDSVYRQLIRPYGINENEFISRLNSGEMHQKASDGFRQSSDWGITGFPTVIMEHNGKLYAVARGFTDLETLRKNIRHVLDQ